MQTSGLYVQVPFCAAKCSFCNFSSKVAQHGELDAYFHALLREIELLEQPSSPEIAASCLPRLPINTIYFGGGTPTLLGADRIEELIGRLAQRFQILPDSEFTVEVAPGSADSRMLDRLKKCGVNRLSIGAQSFDDRELRSVGRLHGADETRELLRQAHDTGFANISLDLIAGLPHQTESSWRANLEATTSLAPEHVSIYIFEADGRSRLGQETIRHGKRYSAAALPDEEFMAAAYEQARRALASEGYAQYEISNFALHGYASKHNLKYWRREPYFGLGAGAHSFDGARRWSNLSDTAAYAQSVLSGTRPIAESRVLDLDESVEEFFFLGLRQSEGVDLGWARARWGAGRLAPWLEVISELASDGWLECEGDRTRLAERAYLISNEIFERFLLAGAAPLAS